MSTRSNIAKKNPDGSYTVIYCHFDGYIEHNGKILFEHYQDPEKIDALLALGDISSLGIEVKSSPDGVRSYDLNPNPYTVAYHRDRNEDWEDVKPTIIIGSNRADLREQEYLYIWENDQWYVEWYETSEPVPLTGRLIYGDKAPKRTMVVRAKVDDRCVITVPHLNLVSNGYVPTGLGIGGGDYIEFTLDLDTGKIIEGTITDKTINTLVPRNHGCPSC